ncbi:MAG TPA: hypothetical protein ENJ95_03375, partial [Bacteroidetes bacterium]|nr:hypothetical protein [Bacteroidota bacterium]
MKETNFTREKTRTGNFNCLEFEKGKSFILSLLLFSLVLFSTNTALASGGFFGKMLKKAEKVMVAQPLAESGVTMAPMMVACAAGDAQITSVCACDDGMGNVTFNVTITNWPIAGGPYDVAILYTNNIPPNTQIISRSGDPADPGGTVTLAFGPVSNHLAPAGTVAMVSIIEQGTNAATVICPDPFAYMVAAPLAITCPADVNLGTCPADLNAQFATWLAGFTTSGGCNVVEMGLAGAMPPDPCTGGTTTINYSATDDCGGMANCSASFTVPASSLIDPATDIADQLPASVDCSAYGTLPAPGSTIMVTNGEPGDCERTATLTLAAHANPGACGGVVTFTWAGADNCGDPVTYTEDVTVNPAPQATAANPGPITVDCDMVPATSMLAFSNGEAAPCLISGSVTSTQTAHPGACGGTITETWEFTDGCTPPRTTTVTRTITVNPA